MKPFDFRGCIFTILNMSENKKNSLLPFWIFAALALGVVGGYGIKNYTSNQRVFHPLTKFSELDEVFFYIKDKYVDSVDIEELEDEAIVEALKDLDPHSIYLNREVLARETEQMDGEYEGIGIEFFIVEDTVTVVTAMNGGPSESVGIRAGDKILTVNDSTIAGVGIMNSDVIKALKGKRGTKVSVGVKRGSKKDLLDFDITRAPIAINSVDVSYMITPDTGFIKVNRFSKDTSKEFLIALDKLTKSGMQNLIIDLRGNGGGFMEDALDMLDQMIDGEKPLLSAEGRKYKQEVYQAGRDGIFEEGKIAVLINEGSASASEIVAGAIQDWDRGIIVGRRSFGKGLVQQSYLLNDGSAIRLTVARYYTPSGRSIQRSYDQGSDAYYENYYNRALSGELLSRDSIKIDSSLIYHTLINNREVFGGGGILPDVFVPVDTLSSNRFTNTVFSQGMLQEFAYDYFSDHDVEFSGFDSPEEFDNQYFINNSLFQDLVSYVESQNDQVSFTDSEKATAQSEISTTLKSLFARQLFGDSGFYLIANEDDSDIKAALSSFDEQYEEILNPEG